MHVPRAAPAPIWKWPHAVKFLASEEAGYITIIKTFVNNKPHTYVEATAAGREAFTQHVAALEDQHRELAHASCRRVRGCATDDGLFRDP